MGRRGFSVIAVTVAVAALVGAASLVLVGSATAPTRRTAMAPLGAGAPRSAGAFARSRRFAGAPRARPRPKAPFTRRVTPPSPRRERIEGAAQRSASATPILASRTMLREVTPVSGESTIVDERARQAGVSPTPSESKPYWACPHSVCEAIVDPPPTLIAGHWRLPDGGALLEGSGEKGGYDPADLQSAYGIPTTGGSAQERYEETQTIALVDSGYDATAESDLREYRSRYGLPACTNAGGCFREVNEHGEEHKPPPVNEEWDLETSLDLAMASAACPHCHIVLVESTEETLASLAESANTAAKLGATEISNSYGLPELNEESYACGKEACHRLNTDYNHPGVIITASAGDAGYDNYLRGGTSPLFPAISPYVIAVGGTSLHKVTGSSGRKWSEAVWWEPETRKLGTGSGCSGSETKPAWQTDKGCAHRTDNDVAAVAACETPVSVYVTQVGGWENVCGTSVSAPLMAGIEAHAGEAGGAIPSADAFYQDRASLYNVTKGRNGSCAPKYLCNAEAQESGYDGPAGNGTPDQGPAKAAGEAPSSRTEPPSAGDTLNGLVDANGIESTYCFEYGLTTSYGTCLPASGAPAGAGTTPVRVSQALTGLPAGIYHYRLAATNHDGTSYGEDETVDTSPPTVSGVTPNSGSTAGGARVRITGSNFIDVTAVRFGSAESAGYAVLSETEVEATSPPGGGTVDVSVENDGGRSSTSEADRFTYKAPPPTVTGVEPNHGPASGGTQVTITGTNLEGTSAVRFGSLEALHYEVLSETVLKALSPSQTGTADITVETPGGASATGSADRFTYEPAYWMQSAFQTGTSPWQSPGGLAVNPQGDVWVSEWWANAVEELSPSGSLIRRLSVSGPCSGSLERPSGLALDGEGNLWVADSGANRLLKFGPEGNCELQLGSAGTGAGQFEDPTGVAIAPNGDVWVADIFNQRVQELTPGGQYVREVGRVGSFGSGPGELLLPEGIAVGPGGELWVSEPFNGRVQELSEAGAYISQVSALFPEGQAVAVDAAGHAWIVDGSDSVRELGAKGELLAQFGSPGRGHGAIEGADGLAVDASGNVWVADEIPAQVEKWTPPS